ncbi:MAG: cell division protein FtsZ [Muribaculaceae bacterium]|nr:cell division protein FtsZ [Muribaculaceae bacterium]
MSESDNQYLDKYKETVDAPDRIMVLGVGGGGNNAVNHMYSEAKIHGVSFVVVNTDDMALKTSPVPKKLLIGPTTTKGRGAGNKPDKAREAAEESAAEISELFTPETDMVFITAGMGGGTGTGAAPVVARIARERGLLTIGIVTIPFFFEGEKKIEKAFLGANELKRYVDALLLINNDRLSDIYPDLAFDSAFAKADDTLSIAAQSISEIVTNPGYINLDMNDVDTTLRDGGTALISIGYGEGENRVTAAIEDALHSPLIKDTDVFSSKRLLFNLCYSRKSQVPFKAQEVQQINDFVAKIDKGVDVIWGVTYDDTLGDKVKFTILAAGFDATVREGKKTGDTLKISGNIIKEGEGEVESTNSSDLMREFYGDEKVDEMQRRRDVMNYIILSPDQLDNDEAIEAFEKTPAFNRKKKATAGTTAARPAQETAKKTEINIPPAPQSGTIEIEFSDDDFA